MKILLKVLVVVLMILIIFIYLIGEKNNQLKKSAVRPDYPKRIISLSLSCDEILLSLVDKSRILALTYLASDGGISNIADSLAGIDNFVTADPERILELKPDLVLTSSFVNPQVLAILKNAGITVIVYPQSDNLAGIQQNIRFLAGIVGEKAKGEVLIKSMQDKIKQQPKNCWSCLYYGLDGDVAGSGTQFDELLNLAGFTNAAAQISGRQSINKEKLLELNPEIIFVPSWTAGNVAQDNSELVDKLLHDPALATVRAIKKRQIYLLIDRHIICSSQYIIAGWNDLLEISRKISERREFE